MDLVTKLPKMEDLIRSNIVLGDTRVVLEDRAVAAKSVKRLGAISSDDDTLA